ncbi:unnamed protein product, partial [Callosobruchus maculatus]
QIVNAGNRHVNQPGVLKKWQLIFYGTSVNPVRLRPANGARSTPWKSPLNTFAFPTQPQPVPQVTNNFFDTADYFKNFQNFPNVYEFSGSDQDPVVSSLDGKKVRDNNSHNQVDSDLDDEDRRMDAMSSATNKGVSGEDLLSVSPAETKGWTSEFNIILT